MATLAPEILWQTRAEMAAMIQQGILAAQQAAPAAARFQHGANPFSEDENGGMGGDRGARRKGGGSSSYLSSKHSRLESFNGDAAAWTDVPSARPPSTSSDVGKSVLMAWPDNTIRCR